MVARELVPIPTSDLIRNLHRMGVDEKTIAASAGITISEVRSWIKTSVQLSPQDEELANAMRVLAWTAFEEAMNTLIYGAPGDKAALVRTIVSRSMGLVGMSAQSQTQEMRVEMNKILDALNEAEPPTDDAQISPVTFDTDDSD
jgi:hypothetical protein